MKDINPNQEGYHPSTPKFNVSLPLSSDSQFDPKWLEPVPMNRLPKAALDKLPDAQRLHLVQESLKVRGGSGELIFCTLAAHNLNLASTISALRARKHFSTKPPHDTYTDGGYGSTQGRESSPGGRPASVWLPAVAGDWANPQDSRSAERQMARPPTGHHDR